MRGTLEMLCPFGASTACDNLLTVTFSGESLDEVWGCPQHADDGLAWWQEGVLYGLIEDHKWAALAVAAERLDG